MVRPDGHDEVAAVLAWASEHRVAVVPFGGGTSVTGGLAARRDGFAGVVSLDLVRMKRLLAVDEVSMTATLEPGLRGPEAEALLAEHGLTLGHYPQSFEHASIGGFAATRSSGQSSAGYGRFDAMVVALTAATPTGPLVLGSSPANAAGPDLRQLLLGSEGAFGVITSVTVRVRRAPAVTTYEGWRWPSFDAGSDAMRTLAQAGLLPTVIRLSDESETAINLADPSSIGGDRGPRLPDDHRLRGHGVAGRRAARRGHRGPDRPRRHRARHRAGGEVVARPLRRALPPRRAARPRRPRRDGRDRDLLVQPRQRLYADVKAALQAALGEGSLVLCHVSHVYETGCSLYFTVAARQGEDPVAQWQAAKAAASDAMIAAGATITHHHAVGTDHKPWFAVEIGEVGVRVLRAVKAELDPAGILNPGVLIP